MLSACSIDLHMEDDTLSFCSAGEVAEQGVWYPSQWLGNCEVVAEPMAPSPSDSMDLCHSEDTCTSGGEPEAPSGSPHNAEAFQFRRARSFRLDRGQGFGKAPALHGSPEL